MTNQKHCPHPKKQSAPPLIPSDPDGNGKSILPLPFDASLLVNSCLDASDTTDPALVVDAIDLLRQRGFRVVVSGRGSHSDQPQHQQGPPRFRKLEAVSEQTGMGKSTILAWESTGRFPRAVRLSATIRVWLQDDVDKWIREKHKRQLRLRTDPTSKSANTTHIKAGGQNDLST